ncbi:hypothetical protein CISG_08928 [Coccidioides immitis RMSCC 3703]|uniref:Uncharacterized protein n=2 Tax=Coccidioides immitis TaxID=5501 RepID=A0A0J8RAC5_COCIT|nr:hypothetical protein CIRG_05442 [Coccidioides immitis RMSCC 2394]KMU80803.1 hypothetical protein CISG_08928 [Coccidioides immitis RMSCC 3703]
MPGASPMSAYSSQRKVIDTDIAVPELELDSLLHCSLSGLMIIRVFVESWCSGRLLSEAKPLIEVARLLGHGSSTQRALSWKNMRVASPEKGMIFSIYFLLRSLRALLEAQSIVHVRNMTIICRASLCEYGAHLLSSLL